MYKRKINLNNHKPYKCDTNKLIVQNEVNLLTNIKNIKASYSFIPNAMPDILYIQIGVGWTLLTNY